MAKLVWTIACESATVDQQTNRISLINVLENINTPQIPAGFPSLTLVILWERESRTSRGAENFSFRVRIKNPSGEIIEPPAGFSELGGEIPRGKERLRSIITMAGIPVREEGIMELLVETKRGQSWEQAGSVPIIVKRTTALS